MTTETHDHTHEYSAVGPREEDLARCVHCGFCLQACPTYVVLQLETESPRGRIALAKAIGEGRIEPTPNVVAHFDLCLQCRACETACPSGVPYGRIIESTRALVQSRPDRPRSWKVRAAILRVAFSSTTRLRWAFSALRLYQQLPVAALVRRVLPKKLREMEQTDVFCGFGGTFSVNFPEVSGRLGEEKARNAAATGADELVACDLSCLLHIVGRARRTGVPLRARHLAEGLAE